MKKTTMTTIANYIQNVPELANEYAELRAELAKDYAKAQANRELYEAAHAVVMGKLTAEPITVADLFALCEDELPDGFTKSKLQYALVNYWANEVVKIENPKTANQYRKL